MIIIALWIYLGSAYFVVIEYFFLKLLYIKVKVNLNSTMRPMNNTKKCSGPINNNKNKLNSKISSTF